RFWDLALRGLLGSAREEKSLRVDPSLALRMTEELKVSIVIATHARPASLARLLRSLAAQLAGGRHELFVAENGTSAPATVETSGVAATHLHDPRPGKCRIQNRAIALAAGEIIILLDDDVVAAPDYLAAVERFFRDYPQFAAMKGRILAAE